MTVKVNGLKELNAALLELPLKIRGRPLRAAVAKAAKVVRDEARRKAPVDTGLLKREIIHTRSRSQSAEGRETYIVLIRQLMKKYADTRRNRRAGRVGKRYKVEGQAFYWKFLEFGTSKMSARPFLRPAFESRQQEAVRVMADQLKTEIEKQARKLAK